MKWHDIFVSFLHAVICERLRTYIARLVCRRLNNFETTGRHGIMPSLRLLREVKERRGDLKQHGACHNKIPPIGLQYSTVAAPRLTAAPHQISNSLLVSFLTNEFAEIHMTHTCRHLFALHPSRTGLTTFVLFASRRGRRLQPTKEKNKRSFVYTTPTYMGKEGPTTLHDHLITSAPEQGRPQPQRVVRQA